MKEEKLRRFINDEVMANAVFESLTHSFLKNKGARDVNIMAAERLAIDLLGDAWKELARFKSETPEKGTKVGNIGL